MKCFIRNCEVSWLRISKSPFPVFNVDTDSELAFASENLKFSEQEIKNRIRQTVSDFHIKDLLGKSLFALSGGQKQKIACASVSVHNPNIIVLDEPSSNLDVFSIKVLCEVIRQWKEQGKTGCYCRASYLLPAGFG